MNKTLDVDLFEYIMCLNVRNSQEYATAILDYYRPEYITNTDIRVILTKTLEFFSNRKVLPNNTELTSLLTTKEEKQAAINVLTYLKTMDQKYNIDELYENTERFLREKAVYHALLNTTDRLVKKEINTEEILQTFEQACTISLIDNLGLEYFEKINEMCDEFTKTTNIIPTDWKWLDERIGGGFQADGKALYVFTGFTNVGKSIFLGNIGLNVLKQDKNVLLITLEMSEYMYARRISSNITRVPINNLKTEISDMKDSIIDFKNEHSGRLVIKEFPTKGMTIHHLNSYIQKLIKKGFKPDIVIVDYLNLMKNKSSKSSYEDVKEMSEQLRASTYLFNIPFVTATQINRKGAGLAEPGLDTISESIGTSFTSDVMISIWSDENDKAMGIVHYGLQKNRFGPNFGHSQLKIDYNTLYLEEPPQIITSVSNQELNTANDTLDQFNKKLG